MNFLHYITELEAVSMKKTFKNVIFAMDLIKVKKFKKSILQKPLRDYKIIMR